MEKLSDIGFGNDIFGHEANSRGNKSKNKQMGLRQTKILLYSKEKNQVNKAKRHSTEWNEIFANYISNSELVFKI